MSHMQLTGNIWWRHHNGKRFFASVYFRMEIAVFLPFLIETILDILRIVCLTQFLTHSFLLSFYTKKPSVQNFLHKGRKIAVPPLQYSSCPLTGTTRECLCIMLSNHSGSKATFRTYFCRHLPADECHSLSEVPCVLLFIKAFI